MSIKESALSAITSIAQSDFIRSVTSGGASRRITVANLAKAIVESYTGSSLAGSTQSVKAAINSLNSKVTNTTYTSVSALYTAVIDNSIVVGAVTSSVASELTNGDTPNASRMIGMRADATTVDVFLYTLSAGKFVLSRIVNGTPNKAYKVNATQITL